MAYLTAQEIMEIDNLNEQTLVDYILQFPAEKVDLIMHIFSKNRDNGLLRVVLKESMDGNKFLIGKLEENGIAV